MSSDADLSLPDLLLLESLLESDLEELDELEELEELLLFFLSSSFFTTSFSFSFNFCSSFLTASFSF
ncbi:hypothetical protein LEP1GSC124_3190 [Leptospira interrogans serovar Pyrogenes str. 200701872]|uniref:Uncharacterized protein n=1 Tax=Leptospira interrogans serovar Pyrogenes str. 200701872 TaxID=1193029 RepID=M6ZK35_LEPIR|nr:hypothetical protein LEP1GSC124_3190 [Leptospira interrogans serovar Pyrogenes str. 200701872]